MDSIEPKTPAAKKKADRPKKNASPVQDEKLSQQQIDEEDDEDEEEDERMLEEAFRQEEIREQEEMKEFLDKFTPAEMDRYEHYRRSRLPKSSVKKIINGVSQSTFPEKFITVMGSLAKVYCGELIERALVVQALRKDTGPLLPIHIRMAYMELEEEGRVPPCPPKIYGQDKTIFTKRKRARRY